MEVYPIDLTAIVAIVMGISIVLVPVIGLTARFVLKPFQESLRSFLESRSTDVELLERRMASLEQQVEAMEASLAQLSDAAEFHRELGRPRGQGDRQTPSLPATDGPPRPPSDVRP